jgi:hypothetical protein
MLKGPDKPFVTAKTGIDFFGSTDHALALSGSQKKAQPGVYS